MPSITNIKEKRMSLKKLEEEVSKLRKDNKILKAENKELTTHNKFLTDRLEQWAERNFQERQKWMNMTVQAFPRRRHRRWPSPFMKPF